MSGDDEIRRAYIATGMAGVAGFDQLHAAALELLRGASSFTLLVELAPGAIGVVHSIVAGDGDAPTRRRQFAAAAETYAQTLRDDPEAHDEGG